MQGTTLELTPLTNYEDRFKTQPAMIKNVYVVVGFLRLGEIDTMNEKFQAEVFIEARWVDNNQPITEYNPKVHWNPKLIVENLITEQKEIIRYKLHKENDDQVITEKRTLKGIFWERIELHNFPVDLQELSVTIMSKKNINEVKLLQNPMKRSFIELKVLHTFVEQQKWRLYKLITVSERASYEQDIDSQSVNELDLFEEEKFNPQKPSKLVATVYCSRKPGYYIFNAFFLIFLITVCGLTIFSMSCKLPQNRLQTTVTLLLTSVSFKWVVNRSLPTISYLTPLDLYAIVSIFYVCMLCVWHSIVGSFWDLSTATAIDQWVLIGFGAVYIVYNIVFAIWLLYFYSKISKVKKMEREFIKGSNLTLNQKEFEISRI